MRKSILLITIALTALTCAADSTLISAPEGFGMFGYNDAPVKGEVRYPVILVEFADVLFTNEYSDVVEHFDNFFNQEGYNYNGATGSVRDYFKSASTGAYTPSFDIYGPVRLGNNRSYYGKSSDRNAHLMIIEAAEMVKDKVDFSQYDVDQDGEIDNVVVIFAGDAEYTGGGTSSIVPTSFLMSFSKYYDADYNPKGVQIQNMWLNAYTYASEKANGKWDAIGTFCHEFSHGLGLADAYCPSYTSANYTPLTYDLMDVGMYNNNSNTPPTMNAFERFSLGWMQLELITEPIEMVLEPLESSNRAYAIQVSKDEYYIFENRQESGWDKYLPGHGMLVWHIDYDSDLWYSNNVNYYQDHQRIDIVEASGNIGKTSSVLAGYTFPGTSGITAFTPETSPALKAWNGTDIPWYITDIKELSDGRITATVLDSNINGVTEIRIDAADCFTINGRQISSKDNAVLDIYDLGGRQIAKDVMNHMLNPGMYVITVRGANNSKTSASAMVNFR